VASAIRGLFGYPVPGARDDGCLHVVRDELHCFGCPFTAALVAADRENRERQPPRLALLVSRYVRVNCAIPFETAAQGVGAGG
jgi:hypothetical protein